MFCLKVNENNKSQLWCISWSFSDHYDRLQDLSQIEKILRFLKEEISQHFNWTYLHVMYFLFHRFNITAQVGSSMTPVIGDRWKCLCTISIFSLVFAICISFKYLFYCVEKKSVIIKTRLKTVVKTWIDCF